MAYFRFYRQSQKASSLVGWLSGALIFIEWVLPVETSDAVYVLAPPGYSHESCDPVIQMLVLDATAILLFNTSTHSDSSHVSSPGHVNT